MNILVCIKQIRHVYIRTGNTPDTCYIDPDDAVFRVNPHDEAATELALRLREKTGTGRIDLLTLGPIIAEDQVRRCLATGPDALYQLDFGNGAALPAEPDPRVKADLISRAVRGMTPDLVLCGTESMDRASGQVGALVAGQLDLPFISAVTDLGFEDGAIRVTRSAGRGVREILTCPLPAVFSVDPGPDLRLPTHEARQRAAAYEIRSPCSGKSCDTSNGDASPGDASPGGTTNGGALPRGALPRDALLCVEKATLKARIKSRCIFQPRPRPRLIPAPDSGLNAFHRIRRLLSGSRVEKKGEILTGSPDDQVDGIINFLLENGFIESDKTGSKQTA